MARSRPEISRWGVEHEKEGPQPTTSFPDAVKFSCTGVPSNLLPPPNLTLNLNLNLTRNRNRNLNLNLTRNRNRNLNLLLWIGPGNGLLAP